MDYTVIYRERDDQMLETTAHVQADDVLDAISKVVNDLNDPDVGKVSDGARDVEVEDLVVVKVVPGRVGVGGVKIRP